MSRPSAITRRTWIISTTDACTSITASPTRPDIARSSTIRAGVLAQVGNGSRARREGLTWKDFVDQGYIIAGSPKTVRERMREAMKSAQLRPSDDDACKSARCRLNWCARIPNCSRAKCMPLSCATCGAASKIKWSPETDARVGARDSRAGQLRTARSAKTAQWPRAVAWRIRGHPGCEVMKTTKQLLRRQILDRDVRIRQRRAAPVPSRRRRLARRRSVSGRTGQGATRLYAPHFPGFGESTGDEHIDDVIDAALFYHS